VTDADTATPKPFPAPIDDDSADAQATVAAFLNREVQFEPGPRRDPLTFAVATDLFGRGHVDASTRALLASIRKSGPDEPRAVLDLGCGFGPVAVSAATLWPAARVVAADRDALAIAYTRHNARRNGVAGRVTAVAGLTYQPLRADAGPLPPGTPPPPADLPAAYDLICVNLPTRAGETAIAELTFGAGELLAPGGTLAVVYPTAMREMMAQLSLEIGPALGYVRTFDDDSPGHIVKHFRVEQSPPQLSIELSPADASRFPEWLTPYLRRDAPREFDGAPHFPALDLAEFDTSDHRTRLINSVLRQALPVRGESVATGETVVCLNPRHGYLARMMLTERHVRRLALVDRDLLALAVSGVNLGLATAAGPRRADPPELVTTTHAVGVGGPGALRDACAGEPVDLMVGIVRSREGRPALAKMLKDAAAQLAPEGVIVLGCSAGEVTTLIKPAAQANGLRLGRSLKRRGFAAQLLRRPGRAQS
jgi:16S rRNA (guanine1207-N2)-methyltransferase